MPNGRYAYFQAFWFWLKVLEANSSLHYHLQDLAFVCVEIVIKHENCNKLMLWKINILYLQYAL